MLASSSIKSGVEEVESSGFIACLTQEHLGSYTC